jgi:hypothetical protein
VPDSITMGFERRTASDETLRDVSCRIEEEFDRRALGN